MKLTKEEVSDLVEMYKSGLSTTKIGDKMGVNSETVRNHLKRNGVEIRSTCAILESGESEVIQAYSSGRFISDIAKEKGVADSVIKRILRKNGVEIKNPRKRKFDKSQYPDLLKDYYGGMSSGDMAKKYGFSSSVVVATLNKAGCVFRDNSEHHQIYKLDHSVFDDKNEDLMYWLGFIASDGNIHDNCLNITTHSDDAYHLQSFLDFCKSTHLVRKNKNENTHRIDIRNRKLAGMLIELGITKNKSLTFSPTKEMCESNSFWRGMIDGDGCIQVEKTRGISLNLCSGSIDCIKAFEQWVKSKTDSLANAYKAPSAYYFRVNGKHAVKIVNEIYGGSPKYALNRKYEKVKPFLV